MIVKMSLNMDEQQRFKDRDKQSELLEGCKLIAEHPFVERAEVYAGNYLLVELAPGTHEQFARRLRDIDASILADMVDPDKNQDVVTRDKLVKAIHRAAVLYSVKELDEPVATSGAGWK